MPSSQERWVGAYLLPVVRMCTWCRALEWPLRVCALAKGTGLRGSALEHTKAAGTFTTCSQQHKGLIFLVCGVGWLPGTKAGLRWDWVSWLLGHKLCSYCAAGSFPSPPVINYYSVCMLSCVRLLFHPMDCSPPGSSICGIFQARILEWVTISSSRGSSWPRDQPHVSRIPCIGRQILYHWATWKPNYYCSPLNIPEVGLSPAFHCVPLGGTYSDPRVNWASRMGWVLRIFTRGKQKPIPPGRKNPGLWYSPSQAQSRPAFVHRLASGYPGLSLNSGVPSTV